MVRRTRRERKIMGCRTEIRDRIQFSYGSNLGPFSGCGTTQVVTVLDSLPELSYKGYCPLVRGAAPLSRIDNDGNWCFYKLGYSHRIWSNVGRCIHHFFLAHFLLSCGARIRTTKDLAKCRPTKWLSRDTQELVPLMCLS